MKSFLRYLSLVLAISFLGSSIALAQQSSGTSTLNSINQSPSRLDACTQEATATAASNAVATATLTPPAGQYVYICSIYIVETINAAVTGAAGPKPIMTSTNLQTNLIWWGDNSQTLGAGGLIPIANTRYSTPLKTAVPTTAFTIASDGSGQATSNIRISISGYFAP